MNAEQPIGLRGIRSFNFKEFGLHGEYYCAEGTAK